jgi:hypothetical protein
MPAGESWRTRRSRAVSFVVPFAMTETVDVKPAIRTPRSDQPSESASARMSFTRRSSSSAGVPGRVACQGLAAGLAHVVGHLWSVEHFATQGVSRQGMCIRYDPSTKQASAYSSQPSDLEAHNWELVCSVR